VAQTESEEELGGKAHQTHEHEEAAGVLHAVEVGQREGAEGGADPVPEGRVRNDEGVQ
jgi:hypothetical protein